MSYPVAVTVGCFIDFRVHLILVKLMSIDLLADKGQFRFPESNAFPGLYRRQSGSGNLVFISSAVSTQILQIFLILFREETYCEVVIVQQKYTGVAFRIDIDGYDVTGSSGPDGSK